MKVSTTSPVRDVRANLQGSFSTFSSRQRQLTLKKEKKSIIHNGQKAEANQVSTNRWMNNQTWFVYTVHYYTTLKKEGHSYTGYTIGEPEGPELHEMSQWEKVQHCDDSLWMRHLRVLFNDDGALLL